MTYLKQLGDRFLFKPLVDLVSDSLLLTLDALIYNHPEVLRAISRLGVVNRAIERKKLKMIADLTMDLDWKLNNDLIVVVVMLCWVLVESTFTLVCFVF